jgi:heme/copper-type cytochrome/quinol oxidase subunit 3
LCYFFPEYRWWIIFDKKMGWAIFWAIFFRNLSGHPVHVYRAFSFNQILLKYVLTTQKAVTTSLQSFNNDFSSSKNYMHPLICYHWQCISENYTLNIYVQNQHLLKTRPREQYIFVDFLNSATATISIFISSFFSSRCNVLRKNCVFLKWKHKNNNNLPKSKVCFISTYLGTLPWW